MSARSEPLCIVAGDTVAWTREDLVATYPASAGWTAQVSLRGPGGEALDKAATPAGDAFAFELTAAETGSFTTPGAYGYAVTVELAGERHTIGRGTITVEVDLTALAPGTSHDARGHVERTLAAIEASLEGRATKDQSSYTIAGRSLERIPAMELLEWRRRYRAELVKIRRKERLRRGLSRRDTVKARF